MRFFVAFLWRRHVLPTLAAPPPCARPAQRGNRLFSRAPCSSAHNKIRHVMSPRNRARVAGQQVGTFRALAFAARLRFSGDSENSVDARISRVCTDSSCTALACGIVEGRSHPSASLFALCGEYAFGPTASLVRWSSASRSCCPSILFLLALQPGSSIVHGRRTRDEMATSLLHCRAPRGVPSWALRACSRRAQPASRAPLPAQLHGTTVSVSNPAALLPLRSFRRQRMYANGAQTTALCDELLLRSNRANSRSVVVYRVHPCRDQRESHIFERL
jgi:hypothetical protein